MWRSDFSLEVVIVVDGDCQDALETITASMQAQTHRDWRLALVDSGNASEAARDYARQLPRDDSRIAYRVAGDERVDSVNAVIAESAADWIAILPSGIILSANALSSVARAAAANPDTCLIYSDDDRIDPETMERWNPFFKPDWSPDLLLSMNYLGPFVVFHRQTVLEVGGLRHGLSGAEVYDLALRVTEHSGHIHTCQMYWRRPSPPLLIPGRHGTLRIGERQNVRRSKMLWRGARWTARWSGDSTRARGGFATPCLILPG